MYMVTLGLWKETWGKVGHPWLGAGGRKGGEAAAARGARAICVIVCFLVCLSVYLFVCFV